VLMDGDILSLSGDIPGVFEARQNRSVRTRDGFINAGIGALQTRRLDDLKITELAMVSGNSVGSFYTRFQDKDAYFRALSAYASQGISREFDSAFTADKLRQLGPSGGLDALVDLIGAIFGSKFRGVLRETYLRIMDEDDPWAPFRTTAKQTLQTLHEGLDDAFPHYGPDETKTRLSFCFQLIVGVIQNDLINKNHVFTLEDGSVLVGLKQTLRAYMGVPLTRQENV
jgi:hypothetical protein